MLCKKKSGHASWCMHVNDSVTNIVLSMSTLLIALQLPPPALPTIVGKSNGK